MRVGETIATRSLKVRMRSRVKPQLHMCLKCLVSCDFNKLVFSCDRVISLVYICTHELILLEYLSF